MKTSRLEVFYYATKASMARRMHQEAFGNSFMMTSWHVDFKKYRKNHVPTTCQEREARFVA